MTTSNLLDELFPATADDIPEQYRLAAPIEQRDYLVDGQLQVWNGPLAQVQSPVQLGEKRVHIGSTPLLDADTALTYPLPQGVTSAQLSERIQAVVQQALDDQRLVGAVVLVAQDGNLVYQQAAGLADREHSIAMPLDALFRLASVSKPIVSTAALALVAEQVTRADVCCTAICQARAELG